MSKQKGNISLRVQDTPSGRVCAIIYRGPHGKRTLENLGFVDPLKAEGKEACISALGKWVSLQKVPKQASV